MTHDYKHLRAWCRMMGSAPYYTTDQLDKARREHAPVDAVYYSIDAGRWATFREVTSVTTRAVIDRIISEWD